MRFRRLQHVCFSWHTIRFHLYLFKHYNEPANPRFGREKFRLENAHRVFAGHERCFHDGKRYPLNPSLQPKASTAAVATSDVLIQPSSPRGKWLYVEELVYRDQRRSTTSVTLQDGRDLQLRFGKAAGKLTADDIHKWPRGKHIQIAYDTEGGAVLMDPDSGKFALIVAGLDEHPIDVLAHQCLQGAITAQELVECYVEELGFWDTEMNRFYGLLMASLSPTQKQAVQTAQREWLRFRDAQRTAASEVFTEGTMSRITAAIEITNVTKEQARRLARYLAE